MKHIILIIISIIVLNNSYSTNYYVSTTGNDNNTGLSISQSFLTISKLLNTVQPGDTAFILEGTYNLNQSTQCSGTQQNPIVIKAYNNQTVILEGNGNSSTGGRFRLKHDWYFIENLEFKNGDAGITLTSNASNNTINNCKAHNCYFTGYYIADGASNNLIINCDAYNMYDSASDGGNADGFVVSGQSSAPGPGNKFTNCRAFSNSDDGFDVWKAGYPVEFNYCLSYNNGNHSGDGNGFKLGINKTQDDKHILKNCIAWNNKQNGFDYNDTELPQTLYNCTAYNNARNYKFWDINGGPVIHNIENCISAINQFDDILLQTIIDQNTNSWNLVNANNIYIADSNFISVNDSTITGSRNNDGSIPESNFLKLKPQSIFIDAGIDVGIAYNGTAPDLGAFESDYTTNLTNYKKNMFDIKIYPNPAKEFTTIEYNITKNTELFIYNSIGEIIREYKLINNSHRLRVSLNNLSKGVYLIKINNYKEHFYRLLVVN